MRKAARNSLFLVLVGLVILGRCSELIECVDNAPKTYEDSEMMEFAQTCLAMPNKYEITFK